MSPELEIPPNATNLISSLRGIGYSPTTAIGDIIDNSISAGASCIEILFDWNNGNCRILILDNGCGMSRIELIEAMRFSSTNSNKKRDSKDLGRFGMGMKSASLSQAKVLKVFSKKSGTIAGMSWDLAKLERDSQSKWMLEELEYSKNSNILNLNMHDAGTLIIWENLDRIFSVGFGQSDFLDLIDNIEEYISTTFCHFISNSLKILINNKKINAKDPLLIKSPYYMSPRDSIGDDEHPIFIKTYLYNPKDENIKTLCFFYRGRRLISSDSWIEVNTPKELRRNVILKIDLGNESDHDWKLDITKSKISIPVRYKKNIEKHLFLVSKSVLKKTQNRHPQIESDEVWIRDADESRIFTINRSSLPVKEFEKSLGELDRKKFLELLALFEKTLYQPRALDMVPAETHEIVIDFQELSTETISPALVKEIKIHLLKRIKTKSLNVTEARESLVKSRIFEGHEEAIKVVANSMKNGE